MMRVAKYIPDRLFGFVSDEAGREVYFHLGDFDPKGPWPKLVHDCPRGRLLSFNWQCPPPIVGELVDVVIHEGNSATNKAPKAQRVIRAETPLMLRGEVESFDVLHGYGFVRGDDGVSYHLHKSEMLDGYGPTKAATVMFFAGYRQGRPRACHVHTCGGMAE